MPVNFCNLKGRSTIVSVKVVFNCHQRKNTNALAEKSLLINLEFLLHFLQPHQALVESILKGTFLMFKWAHTRDWSPNPVINVKMIEGPYYFTSSFTQTNNRVHSSWQFSPLLNWFTLWDTFFFYSFCLICLMSNRGWLLSSVAMGKLEDFLFLFTLIFCAIIIWLPTQHFATFCTFFFWIFLCFLFFLQEFLSCSQSEWFYVKVLPQTLYK